MTTTSVLESQTKCNDGVDIINGQISLQQTSKNWSMDTTALGEEKQHHTTNWRLWCRLCAKEDERGNISASPKDEHLQNGDVCVAIRKHFNVTIHPTNDPLSEMLCTECISLLTALDDFNHRVTRVQNMFEEFLTMNSGDLSQDILHSMRLKYDLLDDDRMHVMQQQQQQLLPIPEVHYFEDKPKINELHNNITVDGEEHISLQQPTQRIRIQIKKEPNSLTIPEPHGNDENEVFESNLDYEIRAPADERSSNERDDEDPFNETANTDMVNTELQDLTNNVNKQDIVKKEKYTKSTSSKKARNIQHKVRNVRNKRNLSKKTENFIKCKDVYDDSDSNVTNEDTKFDGEDNLVSLSDIHIYSCTDCPRKFKRLQHYRQHMKRAHSKIAPMPELECGQCSRLFSTQYKLQKHVKTHLPDEIKKVVPCPYCDKKFSANSLVQTHIKYVHTKERPFVCEECGMAVHTNGALKMHMLTHTDYAPYECEVCKKTFKDQSRLKNHMEIHDPNKHICAECGMQLNSRSTLNRHLLVHSDEMKHKCDYCGRAFKRAKALKNHLLLHTGLKPYACDFCDRTFANGSNCRTHKKKKHPDELAALEASGAGKIFTKNIPKLAALRAVTKAADNLAPVVSKQSGRFASGKKPKTSSTKKRIASPRTTAVDIQSSEMMEISSGSTGRIPAFDNIYNHILKQSTQTNNACTMMPTDNQPICPPMEMKEMPSILSNHVYLPSFITIDSLPTALLVQNQHQQGMLHSTQLQFHHECETTNVTQQQREIFYTPAQQTQPQHPALIQQRHCDGIVSLHSPVPNCDVPTAVTSSLMPASIPIISDHSSNSTPQQFYSPMR